MPELPEVESIKKQLSNKIVGRQVAKIEILEEKQFCGDKNKIIGAVVKKVWRRAKLLGINLSNGLILLIHLKLTGEFIFTEKKSKIIEFDHNLPFGDNKLPSKHTRIIITFDDGARLFFNDLRKFGWMRIIKSSNLKAQSSKFGPEPLEKEFTVEYLKKVFAKTRRAIKKVLLDQKIIAGIGNIYACEILFKARVNPRRPANSLEIKEIKNIHKAVIFILKEAIKYHGTSAADEAYIQPDTSPGRYKEKLQVYDREGEKCFRCSGIIKRFKQASRSTYFCPQCQG